ncbi:MAG TPA: WGR domain-containing protein [Methylocella sp.]|nr:WGR domain-containing protein [Methylocella sp.]
MTAVELRRVDPVRNMRRFYRLDVQPNLFGGVLLMRNGAESAHKGAWWPCGLRTKPCPRRLAATGRAQEG